jgi:hypothetical protein
MGWTITHKPRGMSLKEFFSSEFDHVNTKTGWSGKVLDCAAHLGAAYIAYEIKKDDTRKVIAIICATRYYKDTYYNFGYKDMDEVEGPYYYDCPQRVLDLLTPTDNKTALEWRRKCQRRNEIRNSQPRLTVGRIIEFEQPIQFSNGVQLRTLKVASLKPLIFTDKDGYGRYKIRRATLRNIPYRLIA